MVHDEKGLDQITGNIMRQSAIDEPSAAFTAGVMQSVLALKVPAEKARVNRMWYYWFLLLVPVFAAGGWYLSVNTNAITKFLNYTNPLTILIKSVFSVFVGFFNQIGNISISPFLLICALAILFLLLIESLFSIRKYQG